MCFCNTYICLNFHLSSQAKLNSDLRRNCEFGRTGNDKKQIIHLHWIIDVCIILLFHQSTHGFTMQQFNQYSYVNSTLYVCDNLIFFRLLIPAICLLRMFQRISFCHYSCFRPLFTWFCYYWMVFWSNIKHYYYLPLLSWTRDFIRNNLFWWLNIVRHFYCKTWFIKIWNSESSIPQISLHAKAIYLLKLHLNEFAPNNRALCTNFRLF